MGDELLTYRGGDGRPIVLVHGLMGRGSTWSRQLPWLTRFGQVYTYDAPWHRGRDVADPHPIRTERFVEDLGDAVAGLGRPAILVGHSMGGMVSIVYSATYPGRAKALIVVDSNLAMTPERIANFNAVANRPAREYDSEEEFIANYRVRPGGSAAPPEALLSIIAALGSDAFARLRIGVGRGDTRRDLADHVLAKFDRDEAAEVERMTARAADAAETFITSGIEAVMNGFNGGDPATSE